MKYAFIFPGQGAQYPGMGKDLFDKSSGVRDLFGQATKVAGFDIAAMIFDGSEEDLEATDKQQIAITVASLAARQYLKDLGIESAASAGFSLGEYSALVDSGVLSLDDVLVAVRERGNIMERVSRSLDSDAGPAGMSAVVGMGLDQVAKILTNAQVAEAFPGLYNNPSQTVVSGTAKGLDAAETALKGAGARRVIRLKTSGPFHSPLMADARSVFSDVLCDIIFDDPQKPLYSNVTGGRVATGDEARSLCLDQLVTTVNWNAEMVSLNADGYDALLEVGPGTVLAGHWKAFSKVEAVGEREVVAAGTAEAIEALEK